VQPTQVRNSGGTDSEAIHPGQAAASGSDALVKAINSIKSMMDGYLFKFQGGKILLSGFSAEGCRIRWQSEFDVGKSRDEYSVRLDLMSESQKPFEARGGFRNRGAGVARRLRQGSKQDFRN